MTPAGGLHRTDQRVLAALLAWRHTFELGAVQLIGLRKPELESGERWAARRGPVGISRRDWRVGPDRWEPRPGSTGLLARPEGTAYATDKRVFVASGPKVVREWRWADVHAARVVSNWRGIMLASHPDEIEVDVIATEWNRWVVGARPNFREVAISWLKFEATFAAYQGRLDGWMQRLPARLAEARGHAGSSRG